jgi:fatty-acyl-CoA synthase
LSRPYDEPLTPISFLGRSSKIFSGNIAVDDPETGVAVDYSRFAGRIASFAKRLKKKSHVRGERVAFLSLNSTALLEAHFAIPLAGKVLVAINYRLTPAEILYIVKHSGSRFLFYDARLEGQVSEIRSSLQKITRFQLVRIGSSDDQNKHESNYEKFVAAIECDDSEIIREFRPRSEKSMIAIDYTSGTTGVPKGVMYSHRGAYLNAVSDVLHGGLDAESTYLWTLPMFHCNGWCFTWATVAAGSKNVIVSKIEPEKIWKVIQEKQVTHLCAAPTVLINLASISESFRKSIKLRKKLTILTGGAPPAPKVIEDIQALGAEVIHLYGLTETYGPNTVCLWRPEWNGLAKDQQSSIKARQGVPHLNTRETLVVDDRLKEVPHDGKSIGEIVMRSNTVMLGYFRDLKTTREAFRGGVFHSGDLAVVHEDGYIEIVDRKKDLIISGGEKISSIEVESTLYRHGSVLEAAVIAVPDPVWGEAPKAFVTPKPGAQLNEEELKEFCKSRLAHFKCPKYFEFGPLPKTSTGKVMKFKLREKEWANEPKRIH